MTRVSRSILRVAVCLLFALDGYGQIQKPTSVRYCYTANTNVNAGMNSSTGGGQAHNNIQPYLTLSYCSALQGIFPSRS